MKNLTYVVPEKLYEDIQKRVNRINRRGAKIGGSIVISNVENTVIEKDIGDVNSKKVMLIPAVSFSVSGNVPVVSGYKFLARIEHTPVGNLIVSLDESFDYRAWVDAKNHCDHCSTNRRRRDTFVIKNIETGELKQIGRSCMADYLRSDDVDHVMKMFIFWAGIERECSEESWGDSYVSYSSVDDYVSCACISVRKHGYVPKSFEKNTTFAHVMWLMFPPSNASRELKEEWEREQPEEQDREEAKMVVDWVLSQEADSGYMHNLQVAVELGAIGQPW